MGHLKEGSGNVVSVKLWLEDTDRWQLRHCSQKRWPQLKLDVERGSVSWDYQIRRGTNILGLLMVDQQIEQVVNCFKTVVIWASSMQRF